MTIYPPSHLAPLPYSFEEQLQLLEMEGVIILRKYATMASLSRINFRRFFPYIRLLKKFNSPENNSTFELVKTYYDFDSELRILLMSIIEHVEIAFRSQIAYVHSKKYGEFGYLNPDCFYKREVHTDFLNKISLERKRIDHTLPFWKIIEKISFGTLSNLFKNLFFSEQVEIARDFYHIHFSVIANWMHVLTVIRNRSAHYARLLNYSLPFPMKFLTTDSTLQEYRYGIFSVIFNLKYLVENEVFLEWVQKLKILLEDYPEVDNRALGFPDNWYFLLLDL